MPKFFTNPSTVESEPITIVLLTLEDFRAFKTSSSMAKVRSGRSWRVKKLESLVLDFRRVFTGTTAKVDISNQL